MLTAVGWEWSSLDAEIASLNPSRKSRQKMERATINVMLSSPFV